MSADPQMIAFANILMQAELPTLNSAWGCMDCGALRRTLTSMRCPDCLSESVFDAAAVLQREVARAS